MMRHQKKGVSDRDLCWDFFAIVAFAVVVSFYYLKLPAVGFKPNENVSCEQSDIKKERF